MTRTRWAHWCWRTRYAAPAPPISWPSWWRLPCRRPCASAYKTSTMSCRRWMFWTHRMPPIWHCSHAPNWVSHSQSCTAGVWCNSRSASSSMPTHWYVRAITPLACDFKRLFFCSSLRLGAAKLRWAVRARRTIGRTRCQLARLLQLRCVRISSQLGDVRQNHTVRHRAWQLRRRRSGLVEFVLRRLGAKRH